MPCTAKSTGSRPGRQSRHGRDERQERKAAFFALRSARRFIPRTPLFQAPQHGLRCRDDGEGNEEQQQPQRNERRGIKIAHRFRELVGVQKKSSCRELARGLIRCALPITKVTAMVSRVRAPSQHHAADDADARMRHDHVPHHFPGRGARRTRIPEQWEARV